MGILVRKEIIRLFGLENEDKTNKNSFKNIYFTVFWDLFDTK